MELWPILAGDAQTPLPTLTQLAAQAPGGCATLAALLRNPTAAGLTNQILTTLTGIAHLPAPTRALAPGEPLLAALDPTLAQVTEQGFVALATTLPHLDPDTAIRTLDATRNGQDAGAVAHRIAADEFAGPVARADALSTLARMRLFSDAHLVCLVEVAEQYPKVTDRFRIGPVNPVLATLTVAATRPYPATESPEQLASRLLATASSTRTNPHLMTRCVLLRSGSRARQVITNAARRGPLPPEILSAIAATATLPIGMRIYALEATLEHAHTRHIAVPHALDYTDVIAHPDTPATLVERYALACAGAGTTFDLPAVTCRPDLTSPTIDAVLEVARTLIRRKVHSRPVGLERHVVDAVLGTNASSTQVTTAREVLARSDSGTLTGLTPLLDHAADPCGDGWRALPIPALTSAGHSLPLRNAVLNVCRQHRDLLASEGGAASLLALGRDFTGTLAELFSTAAVLAD